MTYLSSKTIAKAWENCIESGVSNAFMGLLQVMRLIDVDEISSSTQYRIDAGVLAKHLECLFTFKNQRTTFSEDSYYYIVFPPNWENAVLTIFLQEKISLLDVGIICLQDYNFSELEANENEVINIFKRIYKIDEEIEQIWFSSKSFRLSPIQFTNKQLDRKDLGDEIVTSMTLPKMKHNTLGFERSTKNHIYISANAGELSRAPFFQTLYASQRAINCIMITKFDFFEKYNLSKKEEFEQIIFPQIPLNLPHQKIYFGSPGTGKSYRISNEVAKGHEKFVVTFHPDFDYFDFVGSYKPETIVENGEKKIIYAFVAQRFMEAYVRAWQTEAPVFLIIEEINRGRCSAIFGDIFQLLDRDDNGFSEYFVSVSKELSDYLAIVFGNNKNYVAQIKQLYFEKNNRDLDNPFAVLLLPNNLYIHATMNTSDQALFPMDSAFKRRWEWEYVPIDYEKSADFIIDFEDLGQVSWQMFLEKINHNIYEITKSEDKQLGTWFVKTNIWEGDKKVISKVQFLNKIMYYLWYDVFMYESKNQEGYIFQTQLENGQTETFTYSKLFGSAANTTLAGFLKFNQIPLTV